MIEKNKKAVKTVSMIVAATAFSKVLGLIRDILMAHFYGGSAENAAFATASRIPRDLFDIFLGAAILGAFIPVYNSLDSNGENGEKKEKEAFAGVFLNAVLLATGLIALLGILFSRQLIDFVTPDYDAATAKLASELLALLFPMIVFTGAVYTLTGILQSGGEFLAPALVSAVSNLGVIAYFLLFDRRFGIGGLGAAYLVSWAVQLLTLAVPLARKKYKYRFSLNLKNPAFAKAMKMTLPIMAGSWLLPFGMLVGQRFLSFSGFYINAFDYSTKLFLLVSGILTHSICNYLFPSLAKSANEPEQFAKIVKSGLSAAFFVILPVACLVYVLKSEAVAVLFGHGKFRETEGLAASTAQMVAALAPAMMTFSMIEILNRVFYSKGLTKFPMAASLTGIAANIALCWLFMSKLALSPVYVALSVFMCQALAAAVLTFALKKKIKGVLDRGLLKNISKIALSASAMLLLAQTMHHMIKNNAFEAGLFANIAVAAGTAAVGACIYLGLNLIFGTDEAKFIAKIFKKQ